MYSTKLKISSHDNSVNFEYVRWHTLNHLLRMGKPVLRSPILEGRYRPECHEQEFATIEGENITYSFIVDPFLKGRDRKLEIFLSSPSEPVLQQTVTLINKNNFLTRS